MKSFGKYISKHLVSFAGFILVLLFINIIAFGWTFHSVIKEDYGAISPNNMLEEVAAASTLDGLSDEARNKLESNHIWAIFLNVAGETMWSVNAPENIPVDYTVTDVAKFSRGYLEDYPVFVWNTDSGLLVLGYPKDSYTKLTSNYFSIQAIRTLPLYFSGMLAFDLLLLFFSYHLSKQKIIKSTEPIILSIETLSNGKPVSLSIGGELSEVADSVNKASKILSRQNEARANWISGVSHDIRTPLSMIMGYAGRIATDETVSDTVREQAEIVRKQSVKMKELVQDLNLVSQLDYEMQPLHKESVRLSKLLRSYVAELFNTGVSDIYSINIKITPVAETAAIDCDSRLISRAVSNLVQNSMKHNPQGCNVKLSLDCSDASLILIIADNGIGLSSEKLQELEEKPHYMNSTDERLDLRHGLGLLLVRQIVEAHEGTMQIKSVANHGFTTTLIFQK
ncbi:sensor histidine kinase [Sedimentibacter saalensis]|uniref:histidine kinase n=1 Tax=Sedimentibacter saalensis TaxID=130788 RepID=A0A562J4C8_9FIRM|nr:HAMP domain-containing sensor histidine kinase [Sedimentibacter saalensis]TWH77754.1 signal transduction histidine kinase [Sedimentibacter saalensis]